MALSKGACVWVCRCVAVAVIRSLLNSTQQATAHKTTQKTAVSSQESLQRKLDAAAGELKELRASLTKAEAKESRAREEHAKTTEVMRGKLEKTVSEVCGYSMRLDKRRECTCALDVGSVFRKRSTPARDPFIQPAITRLFSSRGVRLTRTSLRLGLSPSFSCNHPSPMLCCFVPRGGGLID